MAEQRPSLQPRPFIGILFECCGVYARIYLDRRRQLYEGRCPRCLRQVRVKCGAEGCDERFFRAG